MEEEKQEDKRGLISDKLAAHIIILVVTIAIIGAAAGFSIARYYEIQETAGNLLMEEVNQDEVGSVENLTSVENINSIEELQKLNEKEIEKAEKEEKKEDKETTKSTAKYYIKVNYGAQVVTIYTKDSKGNYTVPVKAMVCSTGTYTPTGGVYKVPAKIRWCHMIGGVWGQYCTQIVGDILFHSVPYATKGDHSSLFYEKYDQLGTKASLGCIRLTCADAKWIYDNCKIGTQVEFYSSSNPGPLGKPSARKISNAPKDIRGWDPTDPVANNPWKKYLANGGGTSKPSENKVPEQTTNTMTNEIINTIPDNDIIVNDTVIDDSTVDKEDEGTQNPGNQENQGSAGGDSQGSDNDVIQDSNVDEEDTSTE